MNKKKIVQYNTLKNWLRKLCKSNNYELGIRKNQNFLFLEFHKENLQKTLCTTGSTCPFLCSILDISRSNVPRLTATIGEILKRNHTITGGKKSATRKWWVFNYG